MSVYSLSLTVWDIDGTGAVKLGAHQAGESQRTAIHPSHTTDRSAKLSYYCVDLHDLSVNED